MPRRGPKAPKVVSKNDMNDPMDSNSDDSDVDSDDGMEYRDDDLLSDDEQEEVLPIVSDEDEDVNADQDVEEDSSDNEDEYNDEAWGKKKSNYYNTDFVDEDRGRSYREDDMMMAKAEEMDAAEIQRRFIESVYSNTYDNKSFMTIESICADDAALATTDWSSIEKDKKVQALTLQSPEFMSLLKEFKQKLIELKSLGPSLMQKLNNNNNGEKNGGVDFQHMWTQVMLHYSMNLSFYMILKSMNNTSLQQPVLAKIKVFENLLNEMNQLKKKNQALKKVPRIQKQRKVTFADQQGVEKDSDTMPKVEEEETLENETEKRKINYKIAKNKGLIAHRKKEYRNPRVRHRMKFKKALIRRKGQVRTPRTEMHRYGGEASGIHANVTKSIKFK